MDLKQIFKQFSDRGVCEVHLKLLSANDNSKNQIYLNEQFVQILPATKTLLKIQFSKKKNAKEYIFHNHIFFNWIVDNKNVIAPTAKLIFYPQYPEVRLSGFLAGSKDAPSDLVGLRTTIKRVLFLGSNKEGESFGLVSILTKSMSKEILDQCNVSIIPKKNIDPVFFKKELLKKDSNILLREALLKIHKKEWIPSSRLKDGKLITYKARNGGGYTLEAQLGVSPNGKSEPDYLGWEVKQHSKKSSVITLMTPDPDKGLASLCGAKEFIKKYGYKDKSGKENRLNFGGIYKNGDTFHKSTGLKLIIVGFEKETITDPKGAICLINSKNEKVAEWTFEKIMLHWTRKHLKAVFITSEQKIDGDNIFYKYSNKISLGQISRFVDFLKLIESGSIYLDPALKLVTDEDGEETKSRYQFRIKKKDLKKLYKIFEEVEL